MLTMTEPPALFNIYDCIAIACTAHGYRENFKKKSQPSLRIESLRQVSSEAEEISVFVFKSAPKIKNCFLSIMLH